MNRRLPKEKRLCQQCGGAIIQTELHFLTATAQFLTLSQVHRVLVVLTNEPEQTFKTGTMTDNPANALVFFNNCGPTHFSQYLVLVKN